MKGRHQLVGGIKRQFGHPGILLSGRDGVDTALVSQHQQRPLGRVADQFAVPGYGIRGQRHRQEVRFEIDVGLAAHTADLADSGVAAAGDGVTLPRDHQLDGRHLVKGEGARLVRVDGGRRAERLNRAQPLHDRSLLRQSGRAGRQQEGDHCRQAGRNGRDRKRDAGEEEGFQ